MPTITVRDVSDEARNELAARAARSGRSLQEYLREELEAMARRPSVDDWSARVAARKEAGGGVSMSADEIVAAVHADRP